LSPSPIRVCALNCDPLGEQEAQPGLQAAGLCQARDPGARMPALTQGCGADACPIYKINFALNDVPLMASQRNRSGCVLTAWREAAPRPCHELRGRGPAFGAGAVTGETMRVGEARPEGSKDAECRW